MSTIDIIAVFILGLALLILLLSTVNNPLIIVGKRLVNATQVNIGPYIQVLERDGDRLFVVEPDQIVLYNTAGALYYYFEGGASRRLCPNTEYAIVRFTNSDIGLINETGTYNITCTNTSSLSLYEHFMSDSYKWQTPILNQSHTIIDIINYIIVEGYAQIN
ncbi:ODV-e28 [Pieris rapae granulovirus Wuhan]|uniref:ODV-e28 n=1 Tax=Pieris rapae granulovirus Wuhan TaxID=2848030 RepID=D2J4P1_9BBAC|nr:ODV-e28 [Betabaculovirus arrapae]ACZ63560.1 ODV-e28 [Betabaculovirus arrapae]ADO85503.1 19kd [Pieris rapae granulovirus]AGS18834.1 19 kDa protein [Pieris rapae granulovirus]UOS85748.1 ODV-e28 [Pieris rapae granulovirus]